MRERTTFPLIALVGAVLAASACGSVPEKRFFTMANEPSAASGKATFAPCARTVVISQPEIAVPYDNDRIVFRTDDYQIKYFNYDLWVSRPQDMLQQLVARRLERARLFAAVDPQLESARDSFTLKITVDAVEMIVKRDVVEARLAVSFRLEDTAVDQVVWRHGFDELRPVASKGREVHVGEMVRTINAVYNAELDATVKLLGQFVASYPGCVPAP